MARWHRVTLSAQTSHCTFKQEQADNQLGHFDTFWHHYDLACVWFCDVSFLLRKLIKWKLKEDRKSDGEKGWMLNILYMCRVNVSASAISIINQPYVAAQYGKYSGVCIFFWQGIKYLTCPSCVKSPVYSERLVWNSKSTLLHPKSILISACGIHSPLISHSLPYLCVLFECLWVSCACLCDHLK